MKKALVIGVGPLNGLGGQLCRKIANNNLVRAKNDLISSRYDYIFKVKVLDFYQGKELNF